jgi:hypothetical protein
MRADPSARRCFCDFSQGLRKGFTNLHLRRRDGSSLLAESNKDCE